MMIAACNFTHAPEILAILNEAIVNSTALYDYKPRTMAAMEGWFEAKKRGGYPILGAFEEDGAFAGFASYGAFRAWPAYKYSVEHSVYVQKENRGRGLGKMLLGALIVAAKHQEYHMMIGGIDSSNSAIIMIKDWLEIYISFILLCMI